MNHNVARYKNKLKRKLQCSRTTRSRLLDDFDRSMDGYLEENPDTSFDDLNNAFGPPDEMVKILMEKVDEREKHAYQQKRLLLRCAAIILVITLILMTFNVFYMKQRPLVIDDDTTSDEAFYIPDDFTGGE